MNDIEKLLRKISEKERVYLKSIIEHLLSKKNGLNIKKLKGSDFYRLRKGDFRIIFHYDSSKNIMIDSIRVRRENTYRDF